MDIERMSREQLIDHVKELNQYMENVVVFWGGKREFRETMEEVARNESGEFTDEESRNAAVIIEKQGAFEEFIRLIQESFERGGISYVISEKISAIMQEVASKQVEQGN
ncbi:MAG: hypothetical protein FJ118_02075 [Deltaproteobacteria bacterium]|nr:hypothetical protein [Deltaproteobacteria bacterium]